VHDDGDRHRYRPYGDSATSKRFTRVTLEWEAIDIPPRYVLNGKKYRCKEIPYDPPASGNDR
jgi:hypothetical protein